MYVLMCDAIFFVKFFLQKLSNMDNIKCCRVFNLQKIYYDGACVEPLFIGL